ncbi:MAG: DUF305 domain-containing protein [Proteobacteria bacterium]|nr:DUF305 domain-containing protein [Pseudomonadota bacterium]
MSRGRIAGLVIGALALGLALAVQAAGAVDGFEARMAEAMARMHHAMMAPSSGDPDRDFAAMMIPHHQGAVDMAQAELAYGKDERLRRLAQAIIVEQNQEIAVMRQALADRPTAEKPHERQRQ